MANNRIDVKLNAKGSCLWNDFQNKPWHGTPVNKNPNKTSMAVESLQSLHSPSSYQTPLSMMQDTQLQESELENTTIQRQRMELRLLAIELKDRDSELNSMTANHHRQIKAWEHDRQRMLALEKKCNRLKDELQKRKNVIGFLSKSLKMTEEREKDCNRELRSTQQELQDLSQKHQHSTQKLRDIDERNQSLNSTILTLSSQVAQLQDAQIRKHKMLQDMEEYKRCLREGTKENAELKDELQAMTLECSNQRDEINRLKQENQILRKEVSLAGEGETWKDELLALARSKQERTESELLHLRQVYETQQNDLQFLKLNLDSNRELLRQYKGQRTLERIDYIPGSSCVLEHNTPKGTDLETGQNTNKEIQVPPQPLLQKSYSHASTCCMMAKDKSQKVTDSSQLLLEAGSKRGCCCGYSSNSAKKLADGKSDTEVDIITIINHDVGMEDSVLVVDLGPNNTQNSSSGNVTCVYCTTASSKKKTSPSLIDDTELYTPSKNYQEEYISSACRLQRMITKSQKMVTSLEQCFDKPPSLTLSPTPPDTPTLDLDISTLSECTSVCSL